MTDAEAADASQDDTPKKRRTRHLPHMRLRDRLRHRPRLIGVVLAILFFWESLSPTLLPRSPMIQALLCGACTAIGYGIGASLSVFVGWTSARIGKRVPSTAKIWPFVWGAAIAAVVIGWATWPMSQNDQRDLVSMPHISAWNYLTVIVLGTVIFLVLIALGRLVGQGLVAIQRWFSQVMPSEIAFAATVAIFVFLGVLIGQDAVFQQFVNWANNAYSTVDDTTPAGITQPTTPLASGGPGSLVPWDTLGMQGRDFTGGVLSPEQVQTLAKPGTPAMQPIRVYVGLKSAPTPQARADLAVQELERTDAFKRRVLVVTTVTGTGWINPKSARAVEALNGGDTAIVGIQYSYLPSWISFLVDTKKAATAGVELFDAVKAKYDTLPADQRPQLIVFGESLGSFGSEHAFNQPTAQASVDDVTARTDKALWVGPTYNNPIRTPVIKASDPGTPTWRPTYGDGKTVTFKTGPEGLLKVDGQDIVYQQHPSDPVGWWNWSQAFERPLWLQGKRGYDVPKRAHWFPIVTWGQVSCDLIAGFSAPAGHGHNYDNAWPQAWAAVAAPSGWTTTDTEGLAIRLGNFRSPS